jgi:hypothetical protein
MSLRHRSTRGTYVFLAFTLLEIMLPPPSRLTHLTHSKRCSSINRADTRPPGIPALSLRPLLPCGIFNEQTLFTPCDVQLNERVRLSQYTCASLSIKLCAPH